MYGVVHHRVVNVSSQTQLLVHIDHNCAQLNAQWGSSAIPLTQPHHIRLMKEAPKVGFGVAKPGALEEFQSLKAG